MAKLLDVVSRMIWVKDMVSKHVPAPLDGDPDAVQAQRKDVFLQLFAISSMRLMAMGFGVSFSEPSQVANAAREAATRKKAEEIGQGKRMVEVCVLDFLVIGGIEGCTKN